MNLLERGCIHTEVGSEAVEVVEANIDDVSLCLLNGFCSIESMIIVRLCSPSHGTHLTRRLDKRMRV